jgi:hypothetical protein
MTEHQDTSKKRAKRKPRGTNDTGTASSLYCYNAQDWRLDDDFDLAPEEEDDKPASD